MSSKKYLADETAERSLMASNEEGMEVSVVIPCLNEEGSIGACVEQAFWSLEQLGVLGEVVVCDNGSTDASVAVAQSMGARVVYQPIKGYGSACRAGLENGRGRYLVMGDSDGQFDLREIGCLIAPLRQGYDVVIGNRFAGTMAAGAMPWHHRYIGNPLLSRFLNLLFRTGVHDAHCGLRAFTRQAVQRMHLRATGMEFASEMVINAAKAGLRIAEVPVTLYPRADGSVAKLRSLRDGWRHLRLMLLYSPTHLFLLPGGVLMLLGLTSLGILARGPLNIGDMFFGFHWMFVGSLTAVLGFQIVSLGLYARSYSLSNRIDPRPDRVVEWFQQHFRLEWGLLLGGAVFGLGVVLDLAIVYQAWVSHTFEVPTAVRLAILALTASIIGAQTVFSSFFWGIAVIDRNGWE
jgi:glycosyltransferase involved in cell wall biosynthesis